MFDSKSNPVTPLFLILSMAFVTCLLISNIIAGKLMTVGSVVLPAAVILFPITYLLGDVLTEVYGFQRSRLVIWAGFACNVFMALAFMAAVALPHPEFWGQQRAYETVLGFTPRLVGASLLAYWVGEFSNSFVLSKMKVFTRGKWLWARTIGSTIVGEGLDTILFILLAFGGILPAEVLGGMMFAQYLWKVGFEIAATPLTYRLVSWAKTIDNVDAYDYDVHYNPFLLEV